MGVKKEGSLGVALRQTVGFAGARYEGSYWAICESLR